MYEQYSYFRFETCFFSTVCITTLLKGLTIRDKISIIIFWWGNESSEKIIYKVDYIILLL